MKIWYHVVVYLDPENPKAFGFSSVNGIVKDSPIVEWRGLFLAEIRSWFVANNAKCYKVAEQVTQQ